MAKPSLRVRCASCGKWFKAPKATVIRCPDCTRTVQKQRLAQESVPRAGPARPAFVIERLTPEEMAEQRERERAEARARREVEHARPPATQPPPPLAAATTTPTGTATGRPLPQPHATRPRWPARPEAGAGLAPAPPPRQPQRPPEPSFIPTPEQVAAIEQRYRELAQPHEYDGIRHTIAAEMGIPLRVVREVVSKLRQREQLSVSRPPADRAFTEEELARVRERYLPALPLPPIGIHKQIAAELGMTHTRAFYAIALIRQELGLPQYNPRAEAPADTSGSQPRPGTPAPTTTM